MPTVSQPSAWTRPCFSTNSTIPLLSATLNGLISGPTDMVMCSFQVDRGAMPPTDADLEINTLRALDLDGQSISPLPVLGLASFVCPTTTTVFQATTTMSSTTTSSVTMGSTTTSSMPAELGDCGDVNLDSKITSVDALLALRTVVSLDTCSVTVCDVTGRDGILASDVLLLLRIAVGSEPMSKLDCPEA